MSSVSFQPTVENALPHNAPRFAVLGAGHGGQAMAGHLAYLGYEVSLYNRTDERLEPIRHSGGITLNGVINGFGPLEVVTSNIEEAIADADIINVVVPANAHYFIAKEVAPFLRDGQIIVLHPGRTGGALEFTHVIKSSGAEVDVTIAEAQTLIYAARNNNPAQVTIYGIKNSIPVAALPGHHTAAVVSALRVAMPQFVPGDNVLKTSLDNIGAIFHPGLAILNAARIEATRGDFEFYMEGVTPTVAKVLEAMDAERVAVAAALGIPAMSARNWLYVAYDAAGRTLYEAIQNNQGYKGIKAPAGLYHRYITEDVPMSLVPIAALGELLGVPTPTIRSIIHLGSLLLGENYWLEGRTVERMGIAGLTATEIRRYVLEGELD
ncbi:MAG: NAD(P)-binding domain-containing protein [Firmicutes bacterium]|nr:NAD(P)-binding domain-containing protein [Bacillota bacterium]